MQREGIGEQVDAGSIVHGKVEDFLIARARAQTREEFAFSEGFLDFV
jgi:hypothetical protein